MLPDVERGERLALDSARATCYMSKGQDLGFARPAERSQGHTKTSAAVARVEGNGAKSRNVY
jgi:hypothetical protein